jgi:hypothetical protein
VSEPDNIDDRMSGYAFDPMAFAPEDLRGKRLEEKQWQLSEHFEAVFANRENSVLAVHSARVLAELRDFCFAQASTQVSDPLETAFNNGRRAVWLRIQHFINLSDNDVRKIKGVFDDV